MAEKPKAEQNVAPNAQAFAKEHKIDTAKVQGSGFGGRVTLADVQKAAEQDAES